MTIEVQGNINAFQNMLENMQDNLERMPFLDNLSAILRQSIITNYNVLGRNPSWPKRKVVQPWPILFKTGTKRSTELNSTHRSWNKRIDQATLTISSTDYGYYHQYGKGQVVRKSVKLEAEEEDAMSKAIIEGVLK